MHPILKRAERRTLSARIALQEARLMLAKLEGEEAATLSLMIAATRGGEGVPPACEPTGWRFTLSDSRALVALREHPLGSNGAETADPLPPRPPADAPRPRFAPCPLPPPACVARLVQPRRGRELGRQLDPRNLADTVTGQGWREGWREASADYRADRDAAAYAHAPSEESRQAALESAQAALARFLAYHPRSASANAPVAKPTGEDAPMPLQELRRVQAIAREALHARRLARGLRPVQAYDSETGEEVTAYLSSESWNRIRDDRLRGELL